MTEEVKTTETEVVEQEVQELTPVEQEASQHGWKPKNQFDESDKRWISAEEFMERQSFFNKIGTLQKEVKSLRNELNIVSDHHNRVKEDAYKRALAELKAAKVKALEDDNSQAVVEIDDMIADVKGQQVVAAQQQMNNPQMEAMKRVFVEWTDKNAWYNQDEELHDFADAQGLVIRNKNPHYTYEQVLSAVGEKVKKQFPEKFGGRKIVPASPSTTSTPEATTEVASRAKGKLRENDLPDDARKVMNVLIKRIPGYTKEKYLEEYAKTAG